ncbi:MAG: hypothetical protein ABSG88_10945 [Bradyrhizobium sp.]
MNNLIANGRHIYRITIASIDSKGIPQRGTLVSKRGRKSGDYSKPFRDTLRTGNEDRPGSGRWPQAEVNA